MSYLHKTTVTDKDIDYTVNAVIEELMVDLTEHGFSVINGGYNMLEKNLVKDALTKTLHKSLYTVSGIGYKEEACCNCTQAKHNDKLAEKGLVSCLKGVSDGSIAGIAACAFKFKCVHFDEDLSNEELKEELKK